MAKIKENSVITLSFVGKLDNGEIFKSTTEAEPITLQLGTQELPPTLENALIGLAEGESINVRLTPEEGYGERQKLLVQKIEKKSFGDQIVPKPGMILSLKVKKDGEDHQVPATVMEVSDDTVVVDYNHPLAGHHLTYDVHIIKVENN